MSARRSALGWWLLLSPACAQTEPAERTAAAPVLASGPTNAVPVLERVRRGETGHMDEHFRHTALIHDALVQGGLEQARLSAKWLADHRPAQGVLADWLPSLLEMRDAAGRIVAAATVEEAALATGALAGACGACHERLGVALERPPGEPPPDDADPALAMQRHAWATNRLFEGVVLPSTAAWDAGLRAFVELPACRTTPGEPPAVAPLRARVHQLQAEAAKATTTSARAHIYGGMLATCAACHDSGC